MSSNSIGASLPYLHKTQLLAQGYFSGISYFQIFNLPVHKVAAVVVVVVVVVVGVEKKQQ